MVKQIKLLNPTTNQRDSARVLRMAQYLPKQGNLSLKELFEKYNFLGYDNGDGELSCSQVCHDGQKLYTVSLNFKEFNGTHCPNILTFQGEQAFLVDDAQLKQTSIKIYTNFKRCPGVDTQAHYEGEADERTYAELMGHSFACAIKKLFACNDKRLCYEDEKSHKILKPTFILVGRPSSKGWAVAEEKYELILKQYLSKYLPDQTDSITILVLPESLAAMAGALEITQSNWLHTFVQILDLGSSTFDLTTITPDGLLSKGEDSFQFGGNKLDKAMADYGDYRCNKEYPPYDGYTIATDYRKKAKLRFHKEAYYGENGENLKEELDPEIYSYKVSQEGSGKKSQRWSFEIDEENMSAILYNQDQLDTLHCKTKRLVSNGMHKEENHHSWINACTYVMQQFYNQTQELYPANSNLPRRLILTGGVSNMPEVREIAKEIFHVKEAELAKNPSLTVSNGLALILGNEIIKKTILEELLQELLSENSSLPDATSMLDEISKVAAEVNLDYYENIIKSWAEGFDNKTLRYCIEMIKDENYSHLMPDVRIVEQACVNWIGKHGIEKSVEKILQEKFAQMFPDFDDKKFQFKVSLPDSNVLQELKLTNNHPFNLYMFFDRTNYPQNIPPKTSLWDISFSQEERQKILQVYRSHRKDLEEGGVFDCGDGRQVNILGYNSYYAEQLKNSKAETNVRDWLLEKLKPVITEFVEKLTYYLIAS